MIVCYILSYYSPNYVRTQTLVQALSGIENIDLIEARNTNPGFLRYFQTLFRLLKIRVFQNPDIYILGFRGYEIYWLVRLLTIGKKLIFDHFMSPYDSLVNETNKISRGSFLDKLIYAYERAILQNADLILVDTYGHQNFFVDLFDIPKEKFNVIPVSTNEKLFSLENQRQKKRNPDNQFSVLYYSTYLPLHGINIILESTAILKNYPIHFTLILGRLKNLNSLTEKVKSKPYITELNNVTHIPWVEYSELPDWINNADLCLGGHFGNTNQARRVIAGKIFQILAMAKPVIVGHIDYDYGFVDRDNCLYVSQGDGKALAEAILWAFNNQNDLIDIGKHGRKFYLQNFSIDLIRKKLTTLLGELIN